MRSAFVTAGPSPRLPVMASSRCPREASHLPLQRCIYRWVGLSERSSTPAQHLLTMTRWSRLVQWVTAVVAAPSAINLFAMLSRFFDNSEDRDSARGPPSGRGDAEAAEVTEVVAAAFQTRVRAEVMVCSYVPRHRRSLARGWNQLWRYRRAPQHGGMLRRKVLPATLLVENPRPGPYPPKAPGRMTLQHPPLPFFQPAAAISVRRVRGARGIFLAGTRSARVSRSPRACEVERLS